MLSKITINPREQNIIFKSEAKIYTVVLLKKQNDSTFKSVFLNV